MTALAGPSTGTAPPPPPARRNRRWLRTTLALAIAVALGTGGGLYLASRGSSGPSSASGTSSANVAMMGLSQLPPTPAPGFTLTDQNGQTRTMASLQGRVVVVYFMDVRCTDICPLVAQEFINASKLLGARASTVAFVGINVNPDHTTLPDVRAFDAEHGLDHLPNWYFVTGPLAQLKQVWSQYGIRVEVDPKTADVKHTSTMTFIDPKGVEQQVAFPEARMRIDGSGYLEPGQLDGWSQGIASAAESLI